MHPLYITTTTTTTTNTNTTTTTTTTTSTTITFTLFKVMVLHYRLGIISCIQWFKSPYCSFLPSFCSTVECFVQLFAVKECVEIEREKNINELI